jgi:hypothetical protein
MSKTLKIIIAIIALVPIGGFVLLEGAFSGSNMVVLFFWLTVVHIFILSLFISIFI